MYNNTSIVKVMIIIVKIGVLHTRTYDKIKHFVHLDTVLREISKIFKGIFL